MELREGPGDQSLFYKQEMGDTNRLLYPGMLHRVLLSFNPLFSLTLLNPEGNRGRTRKGIKFWMEKLIINLAEKLSFRALSFSYSICLSIIDAGGAVVLTSFRH